jgi:hypothetical protein
VASLSLIQEPHVAWLEIELSRLLLLSGKAEGGPLHDPSPLSPWGLGSTAIVTASPTVPARIELLLTELRLPAVKAMWIKLAAQSDKEGCTSVSGPGRSWPRSSEVGHKGSSSPSRRPGIEVALTHLSCQRDVRSRGSGFVLWPTAD